jgi:selenide,water dikinase
MVHLNRAASEAALGTRGVHAMTDITGFGLVGHAHEMAHLANTSFTLERAALPWLPGVRRLAEAMVFPGGTERNEDYFGRWVEYAEGLDPPEWEQRLWHDPQTSGGLLMAVEAGQVADLVGRLQAAGESAWVIGAATAGEGQIRIV